MSLIKFDIGLIFDTDEVWHNISDFEGALADFFTSNGLNGEKIANEDRDNAITVFLTRNPVEPQVPVPTPSQQMAKLNSNLKNG